MGAILLSDPKKLKDYNAFIDHVRRIGLDPSKDYPYAGHDVLLRNSFGTTDRATLLAATQKFAWILSEDSLGRQVLESLAQNDQPIYSSTAKELLHLPKLKRFRCLGM
jgi:hypothetical protein